MDVPRRRARRARGDDRDRGGRRRPQRDGHDRRGRRPLSVSRSCTSCAVASSGGANRGASCSPTRRLPRRRRMEAVAGSTDGFLLAERDLEIRGAGECSASAKPGSATSSWDGSRVTSPSSSRRAVAEQILDGDPTLSEPRSCARRSRTCSAMQSSSCSRADRVDRRWRDRDGVATGGTSCDRRCCRRPRVAPKGGAARPTTDRVKESRSARWGPTRSWTRPCWICTRAAARSRSKRSRAARPGLCSSIAITRR